MKLLLDLSSLKWFLLHLESVDGPCDHFHRSFCVGMSIFSSKASSGPPTWGRRGWSVILSTYSLQRQGLAFDFSGPGIGWGGDEVLWAHRRQVRPLISSFSVTFFFFLPSLSSFDCCHIGALLTLHLLPFPLCPLLYPNSHTYTSHTHTWQFHTCGDAGHTRSYGLHGYLLLTEACGFLPPPTLPFLPLLGAVSYLPIPTPWLDFLPPGFVDLHMCLWPQRWMLTL